MLEPAVSSGEKGRISVWLDDSKPSERKLKQFHCTVCGHIVFEYYNNTRLIVPGSQSESKSPVIVQCNGIITTWEQNRKINTRCKTKYTIE